MTGRLAGRVAIVTGASRGIGLGIATRLVAEGAKVGITARKPEALAEAVASLGADHAVAIPGKADDADHRSEAVERVGAAFGPVDILVNNTGINPVYGSLAELDLAAARKIFEVNVLSSLAWVQELCRTGLAERGGAIVNVSSMAGLRPSGGIAFYGVTKAALNHLTMNLAAELAPNVRVNAVAPAVVKTRFASALYENDEEAAASAYPLKRLGVPSDVAGAVAFLVSDDAAWITGQTLAIDGGALLGRA
ncbi:SDR family oxidoreductase [Virgisporangium aurantiacum]|uniref:3-oxoacyl-ACP reductase n=1 Tax=Virgisporangium aurantiacum TaxID=175570 RepID=A0A8J3Z2J9_9ACTN|nr:SDR family oxidoreductase [Virgisporangium aurantiacum]GIJ55158.1 3-oxoacyl-ACP reductase [Virgisporangium aurantiacum]